MKTLTIIRTYTARKSTGFVYELDGRKAASFARSAEDLAKSLGAELEDEQETVEQVIQDLNAWYEGQVTVERWTPAPKPGCKPQDRVYVTFIAKWNGGKHWHGGIAGRFFIDLTTGTWSQPSSWAGAATRKHWESHVDHIAERIVAAKR